MVFHDALIKDNITIMTRGSATLIILLPSVVGSIKRECKIRKDRPEMEQLILHIESLDWLPECK